MVTHRRLEVASLLTDKKCIKNPTNELTQGRRVRLPGLDHEIFQRDIQKPGGYGLRAAVSGILAIEMFIYLHSSSIIFLQSITVVRSLCYREGATRHRSKTSDTSISRTIKKMRQVKSEGNEGRLGNSGLSS